MRALTVRWSLAGAPAGVDAKLRDYVADSSHERFTGMDGLAFKTWRMIPGAWFEGSYVFADDAARASFQESFTATADQSPVSVIIGGAPVLVEACEVVAIAEGGAGFTAAARGE